MQETKITDEAFPAMAFEALGYESAHHGEGRWNERRYPVRVGLTDVTTGFDDGLEPDSEARVMTATCGGSPWSTSTCPTGGRSTTSSTSTSSAGSSGWSFLAGVRKQHDAVILAGDFNIAPTDIDVYSPEAFEGATHVSPAGGRSCSPHRIQMD